MREGPSTIRRSVPPPSMRASAACFSKLRIRLPAPPPPMYKIPDLSQVLHASLPGNGFGRANYHISKSKFHHWPVYLTVRNTKITTEVRKIQGDAHQLKQDLLRLDPALKISVNPTTNSLVIKGNVGDAIRRFFNKHIPARPTL